MIHMYTDDLTGETWRFCVTDQPHQRTPEITRGRAYRLPEDWTTDSWRHYWDDTEMVAFAVDYGVRADVRAVVDNDDTERAIAAYTSAKMHGLDPHESLDTLAVRLTGNDDSRFICVGLDRGSDFYALAWGGDTDNEWRDEIEAVYHGDIWRIEVEEYAPGMGPGGSDWVPADEIPEEFYGEDKATAAWAREFPLADFPAERLVEGSD